MTPLAVVLASMALIVAAIDWHAVANDEQRWRPVTKTVPMVLLIAAALAQHADVGPASTTLGASGIELTPGPLAGHATLVFVLAIVAAALSLLGDVLLLPQVDSFVGGLASFLLAHVAYVAAFVLVGQTWGLAAAALVGIAVVLSPVVLRIVKAVRATDPPLLAPVAVYITVICVMAATAIGTEALLLAIGALVFVASDAQLAWNRFVAGGTSRALHVGCIVTYHLAQGLLVLSLA